MSRGRWIERNKAAREGVKKRTVAFKEKNVAPKLERAMDRVRVYYGLKEGEALPTEAERHAKVQGASDPTMPEKSLAK